MDVTRNYLNLYQIRKIKGYPAAKVAMAVGISYERYTKIEKNEVKRILPEERSMISSFFGLPAEVLFRQNFEPTGFNSPCRVRVMPLDELEAMLAEEYGDKLKQKKTAP